MVPLKPRRARPRWPRRCTNAIHPETRTVHFVDEQISWRTKLFRFDTADFRETERIEDIEAHALTCLAKDPRTKDSDCKHE